MSGWLNSVPLKTAALVAGGAIAACSYRSLIVQQEEGGPELFALFFPDDAVACHDFFSELRTCNNIRCKRSHHPSSSLGQLFRVLSKCKRSLNLCMYVFTCHAVADLCIDLQRRGITVRVIADRSNAEAKDSQIPRLRAAGIEVRQNEANLMHHKFAVCDSLCVVTGSFNWTLTAATANSENITVCRTAVFVGSFEEEFEKLWKRFDPAILG